MKALLFERDENGQVTSEIQASNYVVNKVLTAGTAITVIVPPEANFVMLNSSAVIFVNWFGAAVVPTANVDNGTGVEINPTRRAVPDIASFSIISESDCIVSLSFYR